jgi:hypothetical protein
MGPLPDAQVGLEDYQGSIKPELFELLQRRLEPAVLSLYPTLACKLGNSYAQ